MSHWLREVLFVVLAVSLGLAVVYAPLWLLPGCAASPAPSLLNPNPVAGGACHNGDQLGTPCKDGSCAPSGYRCAYDGHGYEVDETQIGPGDVSNDFAARRRDAGAK